jgi:hypothetical protein
VPIDTIIFNFVFPQMNSYKLVDINGFYDKIVHPKKKKRGAPKSIGTQIFDRLKQTGRPLETDLKQTDWQVRPVWHGVSMGVARRQ